MAGGAYDVRERLSGDAGTLGTRSAAEAAGAFNVLRARVKWGERKPESYARAASGRQMQLVVEAHHGAC